MGATIDKAGSEQDPTQPLTGSLMCLERPGQLSAGEQPLRHVRGLDQVHRVVGGSEETDVLPGDAVDPVGERAPVPLGRCAVVDAGAQRKHEAVFHAGVPLDAVRGAGGLERGLQLPDVDLGPHQVGHGRLPLSSARLP